MRTRGQAAPQRLTENPAWVHRQKKGTERPSRSVPTPAAIQPLSRVRLREVTATVPGATHRPYWPQSGQLVMEKNRTWLWLDGTGDRVSGAGVVP